MRWERWLGKARTEGRNWQPSIISLCTWWKTMSSPQVCVTELQSAIQRQEWVSCSRAKQNWKSQRAKLLSFSMTYFIIYFYDLILQYSWMWFHSSSHKQKGVTGHSEPLVHNIHFWLWPNLPNKLRETFHRFTLQYVVLCLWAVAERFSRVGKFYLCYVPSPAEECPVNRGEGEPSGED